MLNRFRDLLSRTVPPRASHLTAGPQRLSAPVCATSDSGPIEIDLGGTILRLYPELRLMPGKAAATDWILFDANRYFSEVTGFARIGDGQRVLVGRANEAYQELFRFPRSVKRRQLEIENESGRIVIRPLDPEGQTDLRSLGSCEAVADPQMERLANLRRVRDLFGGPITLLSPGEADTTLRQVNEIMRVESYRKKDSEGRPGGVLDLPDCLSPIVVGDLHAKVDNLLKILSEGSYLSALSRGDAGLVLLGDAIHSENDHELEQMETSLLILDLIFKLKLRFPENVFYLRGNHESFEERVSKCGVPQGLIFLRRAREIRGQSYVEQLRTFYERQPYVVRSKDFIACHAGPPRNKTKLQELIDIRSHPDLAHELVWTRPLGRNHPLGYSRRQVRRFRTSLGTEESIPLLVSHTPLSPEANVWKNVNGIENHHILYSAHPDSLAVFIRGNRCMVPLEYPAESLVELTNALDAPEAVERSMAGI